MNDLIRDTPTHDDTPPTGLERRVDRLTAASERLVSLIDELVHPEPPRRDVIHVPMDGMTEVIIGGPHSAAAFRSITVINYSATQLMVATSQGAAIDAVRAWSEGAQGFPAGVCVVGGARYSNMTWITEPMAGTSLAIAAVDKTDPAGSASAVIYRHARVLDPSMGAVNT